uniref:Variable lymphocyte receptor C-terminal domain-containing protein n=1 Tax=Petromyzon marinus TaxID=7757 RepID=S4RPE6_PETMA
PANCACSDILYLSRWISQHPGLQWTGSSWSVNPDSAKCSGTN